MILPQAILILNLLQSSRYNLSLSVHAVIFGNFEFNATSLSSPDTKVVIQKNSQQKNV